MPTSEPITALILAGGQGRRMQNQDKGLVLYQGRPLIEHVLERIAPQVDQVLINCNRNHEIYARYDWPLVTDKQPDQAGPLRGIESAIDHIQNMQCLVVACDMPYLDHLLVSQLRASLQQHQACMFIFDNTPQPLPMLLNKGVINTVADALADGKRSLKSWLQDLDHISVASTNAAMFININHADQLPADKASLTDKFSKAAFHDCHDNDPIE